MAPRIRAEAISAGIGSRCRFFFRSSACRCHHIPASRPQKVPTMFRIDAARKLSILLRGPLDRRSTGRVAAWLDSSRALRGKPSLKIARCAAVAVRILPPYTCWDLEVSLLRNRWGGCQGETAHEGQQELPPDRRLRS